MEAVYFCYIIFVQNAALAYFFCSAESLFCRLEDKQYIVFEFIRIIDIFTQSQNHGHMSIVSAGVHFTLVGGAVFAFIHFLQRQRIHVCSEPDCFLLSFIKISTYTCIAEECHGASKLLQHRDKIFSGFRKLASDFRYFVKISSVFN